MKSTSAQSFSFETIHGPIVGECSETSVLIWYRDELGLQDKPEIVYWEEPLGTVTTDDEAIVKFKAPITVDPDADFTSQTLIENLIPNTTYKFMIGNRMGSFRTPGSAASSFVFGSCIGGQGYGRIDMGSPDTEGGGFPIFKTMLKLKPDFFLLNGDSIYADDVISAQSQHPWNKGSNMVTQNGVHFMPTVNDLTGFRGRYKYHLEDATYSEFLRNCPTYVNWDDHEILDNFGQQMLRESGRGQLFDHGRQAFLEYWPRIITPLDPYRLHQNFSWGPHVEAFILDSRSYRDVHMRREDDATPTMRYILGDQQRAWLLDGLSRSKKTWKFIATSVPLSYPTGWPTPHIDGYDGWSNGKDSLGGPEVELMAVLEHIRDEGIENVVFLAGDVHFPYAIAYDPFHRGKPLFHEIGASPLHALCLAPPESSPDRTFNPTVLFAQGSFGSNSFNFGHVIISSEGNLSFHIRDRDGSSIYNLELSSMGMGDEIVSAQKLQYDDVEITSCVSHVKRHHGSISSTKEKLSITDSNAAA